MRMGLEKIKSSAMHQYFYYLAGLQYSQLLTNQRQNIQNDHKKIDQATKYLMISLTCSSSQINSISKKTLLQLHRILQYSH